MIKKEDYMVFDEKEAFTDLLKEVSGLCLKKFVSMMDQQDDWYLDDDDIRNEFAVGLAKHIDRIQQGGYSPDEIVDAINYLVMMYNAGEAVEKVPEDCGD